MGIVIYFIILLCLGIYKLFTFFRNISEAIWSHLSSILLLVIIAVLLSTDNGKDVIIMAAENSGQSATTVFAFIFWIMVIWYSAYLNNLIDEDKNWVKESFPKLLYTSTFAILSVIFWQIIFKSKFNIFCSLFLIIVFTSIGLGIHNVFKKFKSDKILQIVFAAFLVLILLIGLFFFPLFIDLKYRIIYLWVVLLYVDILGLYIVSNHFRARFLPKYITRTTYYIFKKATIFFKISRKTIYRESTFFIAFNVLSFIVGIFYLAVILKINIATKVGPLAVSLIVITILIGIFNIIAAISKHIKFNLNIIFFVIALIVGGINKDMHDVPLVQKSTSNYSILSVDSFMQKWYNDAMKTHKIDKDTVHAYIILSDGGGARAAAWTAKVLSSLDFITNYNFRDNILAIAGASGGSVGNAIYFSSLKNTNINKDTIDNYCTRDFLSYTLARFLSMDFVQYVFPFDCIYDRAEAIAHNLEYEKDSNAIAKMMATPLNEVYSETGSLPAFFINVTDMTSGKPAYISNVYLNNRNRKNILQTLEEGLTMNLSTAAILSARFPYVSPAGRIYDNKDKAYRYYVDGGYFDNSGAGTMQDFLLEVDNWLKKHDTTGKIKLHIIAIQNSPVMPVRKNKKENNEIHPASNDLLSPILTLLGTQNSNTLLGNSELKNMMSLINQDTTIIQFNLYDEQFKYRPSKCYEYKDSIGEEPYAMSWANSAYQIQRMNTAVIREIDLKSVKIKEQVQ